MKALGCQLAIHCVEARQEGIEVERLGAHGDPSLFAPGCPSEGSFGADSDSVASTGGSGSSHHALALGVAFAILVATSREVTANRSARAPSFEARSRAAMPDSVSSPTLTAYSVQ